mmetsp:Transcript_8/g.33  ORF Transcript_8/g.33 Transcript_8/m.33 type:complete len:688 (+) Transcript_8:87-2150(+)
MSAWKAKEPSKENLLGSDSRRNLIRTRSWNPPFGVNAGGEGKCGKDGHKGEGDVPFINDNECRSHTLMHDVSRKPASRIEESRRGDPPLDEVRIRLDEDVDYVDDVAQRLQVTRLGDGNEDLVKLKTAWRNSRSLGTAEEKILRELAGGDGGGDGSDSDDDAVDNYNTVVDIHKSIVERKDRKDVMFRLRKTWCAVDMDLASAKYQFLKDHPAYAKTTAFDELRTKEYSRLGDHIYLDYTGGGIYPACLVREHMEFLLGQTFGNPHSSNPTSRASTIACESARAYILRFLNADPEEYDVIITGNASQSIKVIAESFPFSKNSRLLLTQDNHNSMVGIRQFVGRAGGKVSVARLRPSDLSIPTETVLKQLTKLKSSEPSIFAYPAQSNSTGTLHPLEWVELAQKHKWQVLLDVAAYLPTHRLDMSVVKPDYAVMSFYKIFGYPTGLGACVVKKERLKKLKRPWFAGGTVSMALVSANVNFMLPDHEAFEDGTVNYLGIPAIEMGLKFHEKYIDMLPIRIEAHLSYLLSSMSNIFFPNGSPLVEIHGPCDAKRQGCTIAFSLHDAAGNWIPHRVFERQATLNNISCRSGCFCNPGASESSLAVPVKTMVNCSVRHALKSDKDRARHIAGCLLKKRHRFGLCRISVGIATIFSDLFRFITFLRKFANDPAFLRAALDDAEQNIPLPSSLC